MEQGRKRILAPTEPPLFSFIVWMSDGVILEVLHVVYPNVNTYCNSRHIVKPRWRDKGSNRSASTYYLVAVAKGRCLLLKWTFSLLLSLPKERMCGVTLRNHSVSECSSSAFVVLCHMSSTQRSVPSLNEWRSDWMNVAVQCAWVIVFVLQYYPILQIFYIYTPLVLVNE